VFSEVGDSTCAPGKSSPVERIPLPDEPPVPVIAADDPAYAMYACLKEEEMAA